MKKTGTAKSPPGKFRSISQTELPSGRKGKHNSIVHELLEALEDLPDGQALKVLLADLPDNKANIRSALSRETRKRALEVSTSSDDEYFYVWIPFGNSPV